MKSRRWKEYLWATLMILLLFWRDIIRGDFKWLSVIPVLVYLIVARNMFKYFRKIRYFFLLNALVMFLACAFMLGEARDLQSVLFFGSILTLISTGIIMLLVGFDQAQDKKEHPANQE